MDAGEGILIGKGASGPETLLFRRANRHGLIAGATGTGKTVTLQGLAEGFSAAGVPVFLADVKGDLSGIAMAGSPTAPNAAAFAKRAADLGIEGYAFHDNPVIFWDLFGEQGHPIRTTVTEMGPLLLGRLMDLSDAAQGVLEIAFHVADKDALAILDLDDLQAVLVDVANRAAELTVSYGNVTKASVGVIQRALLQLRVQGGDHFFGEPALDLHDFLLADDKGRGFVSVLAADRLMASPQLYATFLLWLMSELFETLPEVGDPDRPKLVFFFDEAHLLFDSAPKALLDRIEQVVRLIRSKGVGIYFVTQNPIDVPDDVAAQLGNRVQHGLHAFTPRDQAAVKAAATTFRPNPALDVASAITELKVGEALVSLLQDDGSPAPVDRTLIRPPASRVGPVTPDERKLIVSTSPVAGKYDTPVDRESAKEVLAARAQAAASAQAAAESKATADQAAARAATDQARAQATAARAAAQPTLAEKMLQSAARAASSSMGRQVANQIGHELFGGSTRSRSSAGGLGGQLVRGILGGLLRGR